MATLSQSEKQFLKRLIHQVRRPLNMAWLITVLSALLFVLQSWLLARLFSTWLMNYFNQTPLMVGVSGGWFIGLLACFFLRPLLNTARELISSRASLQLRSKLRQTLLSAMATLGANLRQFGSDGSLSSQVIDQTDALDGFIARFSVQKKVAASTPIILLIAVAWYSKVAAVLLFITAPLVPIFMILIGHLTARKSAEQFSALAQLSGRFLDWVRGMPTLKRLQATPSASRDIAISSEQYRRRTMDVLKIAFLNGAVLELLSALSIALVAVYLGFGLLGILPWDKGNVPVDYFGALFILLLAPEFYMPLRQLGADYHAKAQAEGAVQSLLPILMSAEQMISAEQITPNHAHNNGAVADVLDPIAIDLSQPFGIEFEQLSITSSINRELRELKKVDEVKQENIENVAAHSPTRRIRLAPTSFKVQHGERIALVGASGSGKSSLLQAIMGFAHYQGRIKLTLADNKQIALQDVPIDEFRQHIGYLAQQVALMPLSIKDNLRLAQAHASDDDLIKVLQSVQLWQTIKRLPKGMDTQLGERGQGLSGGQQQRLGIAQLLLREDSLWLLDEPTEHLDPDTAEHIHAILEQVSRGKTVIWITHNAKQLPWLDNIVALPPQALTTQALTSQSENSANTAVHVANKDMLKAAKGVNND